MVMRLLLVLPSTRSKLQKKGVKLFSFCLLNASAATLGRQSRRVFILSLINRISANPSSVRCLPLSIKAATLPCGRCLSLYLLNAKYIFIFSFQVLSLAFDQPRAKEIKELSSN
jgi:hypothetical protein